MNIEVEAITLENGVEYGIIKEINNYVLLVNPNDESDYCIRKNVNRNGQEYIESLDSDEEFEMALALFAKEFKN